MRSLSEEVAFGERHERSILDRWLTARHVKPGLILGSAGFHDYDFLLFDGTGMPLFYIEIKERRPPFARYSDAMFPVRKHKFGLRVVASGCRFVAVVEYGCGTLVEVDLAADPDELKQVERRDRPGVSVLHALYRGVGLVVLEGVRDAVH